MQFTNVNLVIEDNPHERVNVNFKGCDLMLQLFFKDGKPLVRIMTDYRSGNHYFRETYLRLTPEGNDVYKDVTRSPEFNEDGLV
jgi:hypothetical protein